MKNKSFYIAIGIVGLFLSIFIYSKEEVANTQSVVSNGQEESQFRVVPADNSTLIKPHSIVKGPFSAKATLVEFLDPECEACAAMYPMVKKISKEFESDLRIVVRYMTFHQNSKYVANILEGARAQNKFWEALELLFVSQERWANHQNPNPDIIPEILKPLKIDIDKIVADAKAGRYDKQIAEDFEDGKTVGVRGTPTFFVNGQMIRELEYEALVSAIEKELVQRQ